MSTQTKANDLEAMNFWELTLDGIMSGTRRFYEPYFVALRWVKQLWSARASVFGLLHRNESHREVCSAIAESTLGLKALEASVRKLELIQQSQAEHYRKTLDNVLESIEKLTRHLETHAGDLQRDAMSDPRMSHPLLSSAIAKEVLNEMASQGLSIAQPNWYRSSLLDLHKIVSVSELDELRSPWDFNRSRAQAWRNPFATRYETYCKAWDAQDSLLLRQIKLESPEVVGAIAKKFGGQQVDEFVTIPMRGAFDPKTYAEIQEKLAKKK